MSECEPLEREPRRIGHESNPPPASDTIRRGYVNLVNTIDRFNSMVPEEERVIVPFGIQEVLADYIAERETVESLNDPSWCSPGRPHDPQGCDCGEGG